MVDNRKYVKKHPVIILLPLDERPCNRAFPSRLFQDGRIRLLEPEHSGSRKTPADLSKIDAFLETTAGTADVLVLSLDMLLYGGLVPSRLHHMDLSVLRERMQTLYSLKTRYPHLKIYAFQCIMRCPDYSSGEEEPDYYEWYGKEIRDFGVALNRHKEGLQDHAEATRLKSLIPPEILDDYIRRRNTNLEMNLEALSLVRDQIIDELVIPQDDCAVYGFSAMDRKKVEQEIDLLCLQDKVRTYPGADEAGLTLISRYLCQSLDYSPKCFVRYISKISRTLIPLYEGQPLEETVKAHLESAGCRLTEEIAEADFALTLTGPTTDMLESEDQFTRSCTDPSERSLAELVTFIRECVEKGLPVTIGDNAYANGGDLTLIRRLDKEGLLLSVAGYAGWNTNANTLGTAIAQAVSVLIQGKTAKQQQFLAERYLEDVGYCAVVRKKAMDRTEAQGLSVQDISGIKEELTGYIRRELQTFLETELSSLANIYHLNILSLPWDRLFEVDLTAAPETNTVPEACICIDLGGTAIKYGILSPDSMKLQSCGERPTPTGRDQILNALLEIIILLRNEISDIKAVCISSAGIIDSVSGTVLEANEALMPDFTGTPISAYLTGHTGLPVHVENDVNCAALAEYYEGTAKKAATSLTLTIGTGIGGAFIHDGKLLKGHTFSAGEVGYIHMEGGSFEELAATSALVAAVAARCGEPTENLNGKMIFERAFHGDRICTEEICRMCDILSMGIANLCYSFNPEVVVLGGGISAQETFLRPYLEEGLDRYLIPAIRKHTHLRFAACGNHAGMLGAYFAWKNM